MIRRKNARKAVIVLLTASFFCFALLGILVLTGCNSAKVKTTPGKARDEKLIKLTLACRNIEAATKLGITVKRGVLAESLRKAGRDETKISAAKSRSSKTNDCLIKITRTNDELNNRSLAFETFSITARNDLGKLFEQLQDAVTSLEGDDTIPTDPLFNEVLAGIRTGIDLLNGLFPKSP